MTDTDKNEIKVFYFSNNSVLRHEFIQHNLLKVQILSVYEIQSGVNLSQVTDARAHTHTKTLQGCFSS